MNRTSKVILCGFTCVALAAGWTADASTNKKMKKSLKKIHRMSRPAHKLKRTAVAPHRLAPVARVMPSHRTYMPVPSTYRLVSATVPTAPMSGYSSSGARLNDSPANAGGSGVSRGGSAIGGGNASGLSQTQVQAVAPQASSNFSLGYTSILYGPAITDTGSGYQPNTVSGERDPTSPVAFRNQIAFGYKFMPNFVASFVFDVDYRVFEGFHPRDHFVRLAVPNVFKEGGYNLYADARAYMPSSVEMQAIDNWGYYGSKQIQSLDIPDSRFSFSLESSEYYYLHGTDGRTKDFRFYFGPQVQYRVAPTVALFSLYENVEDHMRHDIMFAPASDLETGVSWDITPKVNFAPYFQLATDANVSWRTTTWGWTFSAALL